MIRVISRLAWGATAPVGPAMTLPVSECWLHHSVSPLTDDPHADMRAVERVGVQRFGRFSYSWAYHARARVLLEGAGNTVGAHTAGRNSTSLGLVLIGNFDQVRLSDDNVTDLRACIAWLISDHQLRPGRYPTGGHRDLKATGCPGGNAYARLDDIRHGVTPQPAPPPPLPQGETDMPKVYDITDAHPDKSASWLVVGNVRYAIPNASYRAAAVDEWGEQYVSAAAWDLLRSATSLGIGPLMDLGSLSDEDVRKVAKASADELQERLAG